MAFTPGRFLLECGQEGRAETVTNGGPRRPHLEQSAVLAFLDAVAGLCRMSNSCVPQRQQLMPLRNAILGEMQVGAREGMRGAR